MWRPTICCFMLITVSCRTVSKPLHSEDGLLRPYEDRSFAKDFPVVAVGVSSQQHTREAPENGAGVVGSGNGTDSYCPAEVVVKDEYTWDQTMAGATAHGYCFGYEKAFRRCDENGNWEEVNCTVPTAISNLRKEILNGLLSPEVKVIAAKLVTKTFERPPTPVADAFLMELMLNQLASPPSQEFIKDFAGNADNFLQTVYETAVAKSVEMNKRIIAGSSFLQTMDIFARDQIDQPVSISNLENLRMEVAHFNSSAIQQSRFEVISSLGVSLHLSNATFQQMDTDLVQVASFVFYNMMNYLPPIRPNQSDEMLVSPVVSTTFNDSNVGQLAEGFTVDITFTHSDNLTEMLQTNKSLETTCVFWSFSILTDVEAGSLTGGFWDSKGCVKVKELSNKSFTVCSCDHLTHFAVLLSPVPPESKDQAAQDKVAEILGVASYICLSISLVALVATCVTLICFRSLWNTRNYIHINLCISLFVAQLTFIAGVNRTEYQDVCAAIAVLLHYFFLVTFMWMLVEGIFLYVALVKVFYTKPWRYILCFTLLSYGLPLLYMALCVPLGFLLWSEDQRGYGYPEACWLRYDTGFVWSFITPVIIIIMINCVFLVMVLAIAWSHRGKRAEESKFKSAKHWLKVSISLMVIMGIPWIIGVVILTDSLLPLAYIYSIFIALQGLFIFVLFVLCSRKVREVYKGCCLRAARRSVVLSNIFTKDSAKTSALGKTVGTNSHTALGTSNAYVLDAVITNPSTGKALGKSNQALNPSDISLRTMVKKVNIGQEIEEEDLEEYSTAL